MKTCKYPSVSTRKIKMLLQRERKGKASALRCTDNKRHDLVTGAVQQGRAVWGNYGKDNLCHLRNLSGKGFPENAS